MNPFLGQGLHDFMRRYRRMATFGFMIEDTARGRVVNWPIVGPVMLYNLSPVDAQKMKRATVFLARAFLRHGARRIVPMVRSEVREIRDEKDLHAYEEAPIEPRHVESAAFHPLGTARMGRNDQVGVVDPRGKVFGLNGLYVCDGSIVPSPLGVNPQVTIMALATRLAQFLHAEHSQW